MKHVVKGHLCRVQLQVFDIVHYDNPEWRTVTFSVEVLTASAHPNTAFSAGSLAYYGPDLMQAGKAVKARIGGFLLPDKFQPYLDLWIAGKVYDGANKHEWEEHGRKLSESMRERERKQMKEMMAGWKG